MIARLFSTLKTMLTSPYFGFIEGHSHLDADQLKTIKGLIGDDIPDIIKKFESNFSTIIGQGDCVAYAAGRMGFYDLMRLLNIKHGDEVILLGATCSVMSNAVLRLGATPVYSDIDIETYGSSLFGIESCINDSTRMIVAQHSFGIPCDIDKIAKLAKLRNIFLLEDCALTLGSKLDNTVVGNFGDAALFSTDHSKPINTLTGGLIYSQDRQLIDSLRISRDHCNQLPIGKQYALWRRLLLERWFCNSKRYGSMGVVNLIYTVLIYSSILTQPFLANDFKSSKFTQDYPYPAKLPSFLAQLGLYEIRRWEANMKLRIKLKDELLILFSQSVLMNNIPAVYADDSRVIVPLRFAWNGANGQSYRSDISKFIDVGWTWFMSPIVATKEPLENYKYVSGSCPISENIGPGMVNIPCNIKENEHEKILSKVKNVLS